MIGEFCPLESPMSRRVVHTTHTNLSLTASICGPVKIWIMLGAPVCLFRMHNIKISSLNLLVSVKAS